MRELLLVDKSNAKGIDEILQRLDAAGIALWQEASKTENGRHP